MAIPLGYESGGVNRIDVAVPDRKGGMGRAIQSADRQSNYRDMKA